MKIITFPRSANWSSIW